MNRKQRQHKRAVANAYCPPLSPLYRLRSVKPEELTCDGDLLVKVREVLSGVEERGSALWNAWHESGCEEMTAEEVMEILESI